MKRSEKASRRIPEEKSATKDEIAPAVETLTPQELLRLREYARWRIRGMGCAALGQDWEDLIGKAISATYDGRRRWNKDAADFRRHLEGAMRSISSHERDHLNPSEASLESDLVHTSAEGNELNPMANVESSMIRPDLELEIKDEVARIDSIASKNSLAWLIWDGFRSGMNSPEIRDALSISQKEYDTAMKWLRRNVQPSQNKEVNR